MTDIKVPFVYDSSSSKRDPFSRVLPICGFVAEEYNSLSSYYEIILHVLTNTLLFWPT